MPAKPRKLPAKPRADVTHHVDLRLPETDLVTLRAAAADVGLPLATWIRVVALAAAKSKAA